MIEAQSRYVVDAIKLAESHGAAALDVRPAVQDEFQREIQAKLVKGGWTQGGCTSWYLDARGVNRTIWPAFHVDVLAADAPCRAQRLRAHRPPVLSTDREQIVRHVRDVRFD